MKFMYLGTAAAEGWPAVFCQCPACLEAQRLGGKNIRTRAQALINEDLLIDLPPDTYMHKLQHNLDLTSVRYLLITHCHMDHFYPQELTVRGSGYSPVMTVRDLHIYCAQETKDQFYRCHNGELDRESDEALHWHILKAFEPVQAGPYRIVPLPARHMGEGNEPFVYHIEAPRENGEGNVSVFYLHDSGYYAPEVWEYFRNLAAAADLISIDSTSGDIDTQFKGGHLGVPDVLRVKKEMEAIGMVDAHTHFVMNHFSHNGHLLHHQLEALAGPAGAEVSYDGKSIYL